MKQTNQIKLIATEMYITRREKTNKGKKLGIRPKNMHNVCIKRALHYMAHEPNDCALRKTKTKTKAKGK